jgi:hypothetical protein
LACWPANPCSPSEVALATFDIKWSSYEMVHIFNSSWALSTNPTSHYCHGLAVLDSFVARSPYQNGNNCWWPGRKLNPKKHTLNSTNWRRL